MKKKLLSIALVGFAFVASSQTTIFHEDFNSYTSGTDLSSDLTGASPGQGGWTTKTLLNGRNSATQIFTIDPSTNDNGLEITGYELANTTPTSSTRSVSHNFTTAWANRPTGQNFFNFEFLMNVGGITTSTNNFTSYVVDQSGQILMGVRFDYATREIYGLVYDEVTPATTPATFDAGGVPLGAAFSKLKLNDNDQLIRVGIGFDVLTGDFYIGITGVTETLDGMLWAVSAPLIGKIPYKVQFLAIAGVDNIDLASIKIDDINVKAQSCIFPVSSEFKYNAISACVGSADLTPELITTASTGTFTVTPSTGLTINSTTGVINMTTATAGTYTIKYTTNDDQNLGMCPDFHSEQIEIKSSPVATISASGATTFCQGSPVQVTLTSSTGNSYEWKKDATTLGSSNTQAVTEAGSYTVKVTGSNGCSTISSPTVVSLNPIVTPHFNSVSVCTGSIASLPTSSTDATPITGTWTPSVAPITTATTYTFHPSPNQCVTSAIVTSEVQINALPIVSITTVGNSFCQGTAFTLTSSNGSSYEWKKDATTLGSATTQQVTEAGSYTVKVTDGNGCSAVSSPKSLTIDALPTASISTNTSTTFCQGSSVLLTSSTGNSYEWKKDATTLGSLITQAVTEAGSYTVKVTGVNGCSAVSSATVVTVNTKVTPTFNLSDNVFKGAAAITLPTSSTNVPAITGTWSKGSSSAIVSSIATSTLGAIVYTFTPSSSFCATNYTKTINCVVGIEETIISPFTIYPNPTNDVISVSFSELTSRNGTIRFISADGKLIESREYTNSSVETFDVKTLNPGIYFLQIDNSTEKVIVQ